MTYSKGSYSLVTPFYFSTTTSGACYCSQRPELIWDPTATVSKHFNMRREQNEAFLMFLILLLV